MSIGSDIDDVIAARYQGFSGFGELAQLERLFDPAFVSALQSVLAATPNTKSIKVRLDWIDKRPYADMAVSAATDINGNRITRPVELGDAAIFVMEAFSQKGQIVSRSGRGLIIQAKAAPSASMARVPVTALSSSNPDLSTKKELALLSQWPRFDLHLANNRRGKLLGTYSLSTTSSPLPYGWYAAAPGNQSIGWDTNGQWRSRWMCAPAINNQPCDTTLGEVIDALFHKQKINGASVGADCFPVAGMYQAFHLRGALPAPTDWDKLCTTLLELVGKKHQVSSGAHGVFASFPYIPWLARIIGNCRIGRWLYGDRHKQGGFPIIVIDRTRPD